MYSTTTSHYFRQFFAFIASRAFNASSNASPAPADKKTCPPVPAIAAMAPLPASKAGMRSPASVNSCRYNPIPPGENPATVATDRHCHDWETTALHSVPGQTTGLEAGNQREFNAERVSGCVS